MADVLSGLEFSKEVGRKMYAGITHASWIIVIGLTMVITGLLHLNSVFDGWDARNFQYIHIRLRRFSRFFRYIRPLGTVPVGILLIMIIYIASWQAGIIATLTYILSAIIERTIKMTIQRPRPFVTLSNVKIGQLSEPLDPSHPSGDTLRVWLLALIFPLAFTLSWPAFAISILIAITLSLGRIVLGVHYPLDVIGGAGLGIFSAGIAMISYQLIVIN